MMKLLPMLALMLTSLALNAQSDLVAIAKQNDTIRIGNMVIIKKREVVSKKATIKLSIAIENETTLLNLLM
jgi:hypothetical protein